MILGPSMHLTIFSYETFERPVEADAKHPVLAEGSEEQFVVFSSLPILGKGSLCQGYLADSVTCNQIRCNPSLSLNDGGLLASVPVGKGFWGRVASP